MRSALSGLLLLVALAAPKSDPDLFRSEIARLEMRKPHGWHFQTLETVLTNRANVKLKDGEFERLVRERAATPLVVATKHEEPYDSLNATLQVLVRPAGPFEGLPAEEILGSVLPVLQTQFTNYSELSPVRSTKVGGQPAARVTIAYTLKTQDEREFPTRATLVMIPRGKVLYQLGISGPSTGPDVPGAEVDSVLASVRFLE